MPAAMSQESVSAPVTRSTTVLLVRRDGHVAMAGDGQVTMNNTVIKSRARKVRRIGEAGKVLVGFAGAAADGLALVGRLEDKLQEYRGNLERAVVELAKDWRTDRVLRQLQALLLVADRHKSFYLSGTGDLLQPDEDEILAVGSGSNFALAAARALVKHTSLSAAEIARESLAIAAEICVFTNDQLTLEEL
jgi:ATP-dependent HslUV protease, peptidase subunit HslV